MFWPDSKSAEPDQESPISTRSTPPNLGANPDKVEHTNNTRPTLQDQAKMHSSLVSPNSQIIHLVNASVDTLDALPPNLTRSISDLRELDAVLATNLDQITNNLNLLHKMMVNPDQFNQQDRLRLLRLVTDLTRQFRRAHGVEDKIRVATNTTETVTRPDFLGSWTGELS